MDFDMMYALILRTWDDPLADTRPSGDSCGRSNRLTAPLNGPMATARRGTSVRTDGLTQR